MLKIARGLDRMPQKPIYVLLSLAKESGMVSLGVGEPNFSAPKEAIDAATEEEGFAGGLFGNRCFHLSRGNPECELGFLSDALRVFPQPRRDGGIQKPSDARDIDQTCFGFRELSLLY